MDNMKGVKNVAVLSTNDNDTKKAFENGYLNQRGKNSPADDATISVSNSFTNSLDKSSSEQGLYTHSDDVVSDISTTTSSIYGEDTKEMHQSTPNVEQNIFTKKLPHEDEEVPPECIILQDGDLINNNQVEVTEVQVSDTIHAHPLVCLRHTRSENVSGKRITVSVHVVDKKMYGRFPGNELKERTFQNPTTPCRKSRQTSTESNKASGSFRKKSPRAQYPHTKKISGNKENHSLLTKESSLRCASTKLPQERVKATRIPTFNEIQNSYREDFRQYSPRKERLPSTTTVPIPFRLRTKDRVRQNTFTALDTMSSLSAGPNIRAHSRTPQKHPNSVSVLRTRQAHESSFSKFKARPMPDFSKPFKPMKPSSNYLKVPPGSPLAMAIQNATALKSGNSNKFHFTSIPKKRAPALTELRSDSSRRLYASVPPRSTTLVSFRSTTLVTPPSRRNATPAVSRKKPAIFKAKPMPDFSRPFTPIRSYSVQRREMMVNSNKPKCG